MLQMLNIFAILISTNQVVINLYDEMSIFLLDPWNEYITPIIVSTHTHKCRPLHADEVKNQLKQLAVKEQDAVLETQRLQAKAEADEKQRLLDQEAAIEELK